jgi:hypothetical protein
MVVAPASKFLMSPNGWTALGACVAAGVAIIAAVIGGWQLFEARRLRREQTQPYVVVFTDESGNDPRHIDLVIKNFGATAAKDVRVTFSAPLDSAVLGEHSAYSPIRTPEVIPVLVPSQEWRTFWDFSPARDEAKELPRQYTATVVFKDLHRKKPYEFKFVLDWDVLISRAFVTVRNLHDIGRAALEIRDTFNKWGERGGGLSVVARDGDRKDRRLNRLWAEREAEHRGIPQWRRVVSRALRWPRS